MTHAPLIHPLPHTIDLLALQQHDPARFPLLMESTASGTAQGRWSLLLAAQGDCMRLDADGQVRDQHDVVQLGSFLQVLDRAWQAARLPHDGSHSLPFRGGWALMLDYEVASQIETVLPARARDDGRPTALALRAASVIEAGWRALRLRSEPPITRFAVAAFAYSKTFNPQRMLADLGPPQVSLEDGIERFITEQRAQWSA